MPGGVLAAGELGGGGLGVGGFAEGFPDVGAEAGNGVGDDLGFMGKGREDEAELEGNAVDAGKGAGDGNMESAESAWNGNEGTQGTGEHQEEGIDHAEGAGLLTGCGHFGSHSRRFDSLDGPHDRGTHEPVADPYQNGVEDEQPSVAHVEAAFQSLADSGDDSPYFPPDAAAVAEPPAQIDEQAQKDSCSDNDPDEAHFAGEAGEDVVSKELPEFPPHERKQENQDDDNRYEIPKPVDDNCPEYLVDAGKFFTVRTFGGMAVT